MADPYTTKCPGCDNEVQTSELYRVDLDVGTYRTYVCKTCDERLESDMWINKEVWNTIDPVTPYEELFK